MKLVIEVLDPTLLGPTFQRAALVAMGQSLGPSGEFEPVVIESALNPGQEGARIVGVISGGSNVKSFTTDGGTTFDCKIGG